MKRTFLKSYVSSIKTGKKNAKKGLFQPAIPSTLDSNFLIENIKDAVITLDPDHCIQSWNPGASEIYGWSEEETIGQKPNELLKTNYGSFSAEDILGFLQTRGYFRGEVIEQHKSGEKIHVFMSASALYDEAGGYIGIITINKNISERKKAEQKILQLNKQLTEKVNLQTTELSHIFDRITDGFIALNNQWCFTYVNHKAAEIFERYTDELIGKCIWDVFPDIREGPIYKNYQEAFDKQEYRHVEFYYAPFRRWIEIHIYPSSDGISAYFRDITEKKKVSDKLNKTTRLYQFISQINQMILRSTELTSLFREACSIAIETGKYRMAWIGLINETGNELRPVMFDGLDTDYVHVIKIVTDQQAPEGNGPAGRCIRERKAVFSNDIRNDVSMLPWKEAALARNYLSVISLPVSRNGRIIGAFSLYADMINHFDEEEISLLGKVVDDINFGIENIEREEERKKTELSIIKYYEQLKLSQEIAGIGYWEQDLNGQNHFWSEEMYHLLDQKKNDHSPNLKDITDRIHPDDREFFMRELENSVQHKYLLNTEFRYITKNNSIQFFAINANIVYSINGEPVCLKGTLQDITKLKKVQQDILNEKILSDSVINGLPGIFVLTTTEGKFLRWNRNLETVSGYSEKEIGDMQIFDFFEEKERLLLMNRFALAFENSEENIQTNLLLKSKETIPYYFTVITIFYENRECLMGIGIDFSERQKNLEELEYTSNQMQELSAHLITIREEERKRIGRELHDELGQQLTAMKMDIAWMNKKIPDDLVPIKTKMKYVLQLLEGSNASIRRILTELRPSILDEYGLLEALNWYAAQYLTNTGVPVKIVCPQQEIKVAETIATSLFRIFQESLTNISRYAKATEVFAHLTFTDEEIQLSIVDNGLGFDPQKEQPKTRKTFGILGMKERIRALKGDFVLQSSPGNGTSIKVSIPLLCNL
ncbi:MAG: PAS domain S-box protein [Bacteroidota bacterium]|nr:PAS domain S-box protein [Bacteroidota bacterium]